MGLDQSGRYEEVAVYVSTCFGLEFGVGRTGEDPVSTYQLAISSDVDVFNYDGSEKEVDATRYVLLLLIKAAIKASPREQSLLY